MIKDRRKDGFEAESLAVHVARSLAPTGVEMGSSEWRFWLRMARKAIYALETSTTHSLVRRVAFRGDVEWWIWDPQTQELVPREMTDRPPKPQGAAGK